MPKMNKGRKEEILGNEWSDNILEKIASSIKFPKEVFEKVEIKSIISRFFHFYFTGNVASDCTVPCTIYSAISLLNVYNSKGFSRIFAPQDYMSIGETTPFFTTHKHENLSSFQHSDNLDKISFETEIRNILFNWNNITIHERSKLMRLTAFLALKFCSVASKNKTQILSSFTNTSINNFRNILCEVVGWDIKRYYSIPNPHSIDKTIAALTGDEISRFSLRSLFAIVVRQWIYNVRLYPKDKKTSSLIFESLLDGTAGNGIGLITLTASVLYSMDVTFDHVLNGLKKESEAFDKYEASWKKLLEFKTKFLNKNDLQLSYPWARLIMSKYLAHYSAPNNVFLCGILATIVEKYEGSEVWNASWVKQNPSCLSEAKKIGKKIHDHLL